MICIIYDRPLNIRKKIQSGLTQSLFISFKALETIKLGDCLLYGLLPESDRYTRNMNLIDEA